MLERLVMNNYREQNMKTINEKIEFKIETLDSSYNDESWTSFTQRIETALNDGFCLHGSLTVNYVPQPNASEGYNIYSQALTKNNNRAMGFYRLKEVLEIIPISKSYWYLQMEKGNVQKPILLSEGISVWEKNYIHDLAEDMLTHSKQSDKPYFS